MPKQTNIKNLLQKQIEELRAKLAESRASLVYYTSVVGQQEDELHKLENAKASLDGTLPLAPNSLPYYDKESVNRLFDQGGPPNVFAAPIAKPQTVKIGDEDVIVEPGFHVEKNSFGEDCIVPDGVKYVPAEEPKATPDTSARFSTEAAIPLPAITSGEEFESPEDIISGELPNG